METGPPVESLEDYDDMLDEWAHLMDSGDYAGVLTMLEKRLAHVEGLPPLDEILSSVRAFAHFPGKCRCFTSHYASLNYRCYMEGCLMVQCQHFMQLPME